MDMTKFVIDLVLIFGLGVIAGLPLPFALLSRRHLERSWHSHTKCYRWVRSSMHIVLIFLGITLPWLMYWVCRHWLGKMGVVEAVFFVSALICTPIILIVKYRLHDHKEWR